MRGADKSAADTRARMHHIRPDQLVIVGGLTRSGKSTLINRILNGHCPQLSKQLGIKEPSTWQVSSANTLDYFSETPIDKLILHFDIFAQFRTVGAIDRFTRLVANSGNVVVLTLYCDPRTVIQRHWKKNLDRLRNRSMKKNISFAWRFLRVRKLMRSGAKVRQQYVDWFDLLESTGVVSGLMVDTSSLNPDKCAVCDKEKFMAMVEKANPG